MNQAIEKNKSYEDIIRDLKRDVISNSQSKDNTVLSNY